MPNVQDTESHTMQRAGEPDANTFENLAEETARRRGAFKVSSINGLAWLVPSSSPLSNRPPLPPRVLMVPHRGQLRYLPDPHRAWSHTDPGAAQRKSFRDSNVKSKLNFESQRAEEVPRGLRGVPEPFLPNPPCLAHVEEQQRDFRATRTL